MFTCGRIIYVYVSLDQRSGRMLERRFTPIWEMRAEGADLLTAKERRSRSLIIQA